MKELNPMALAWAFGLVEALFVLVIWVLGLFGMGAELIDLIGVFYVGFDATVLGLVIGLVEALVIAGLAGYVAAWLYNMKVAKHAGKGGMGGMKKKKKEKGGMKKGGMGEKKGGEKKEGHMGM